MAWARMVSATGLAWAAAIGAAPRMISPIAPTAGDRTDARRRQGLRAGATFAAGPASPAAPWPCPRWLARLQPVGRGRAGQREVAGGGEQGERDHAVGVGAQAAEEAEVLDQHPVRQAQHDEAGQHRPDQPGTAGEEHRAGNGERG